jgi:hypothetical protein
VGAELGDSFKNLSLNAFGLSKASGNALKAIYGTSDDIVLFWAHHEKLCVIDRKVGFMGGLDMCTPTLILWHYSTFADLDVGFGRWDTSSEFCEP